MYNKCKFIFLPLLLLSSIFITFGLNENLINEGQCFKPAPKVDKKFDLQWFGGVKIWYSVYGSKEGFYRISDDVVHDGNKLQNLTDEEVMTKGCFTLSFSSGIATLKGFGGKKEKFQITSPSKGIFTFKPIIKSSGATGGNLVVSLTDNKYFVFTAQCLDGDEKAWLVASPYKSVDKSSENAIYEHAKSLGFNKKYFEKQDNSMCSFDNGIESNSKSEENYYYDENVENYYEHSVDEASDEEENFDAEYAQEDIYS